MTQYAYPDAHIDVSTDWEDHDGNIDTNLWQDVDDAFNVAGSGTYATIVDMEGEEDTFPVRWGMSDITDPNGAVGDYKIHLRMATEYGMGDEEVVAKLYKDGSTKFAESAALNPPAPSEGMLVWGDRSYSLTSSEITAGGTFQNLELRLEYTDTNGNGGTLWVAKAYFECPDAASAATTSPAFLLFV
jgi:hypothetical protein